MLTWEHGAEQAADYLLSGLIGSSAPVPVLVDELKRDVRLLREDHFDQGRFRRWFFGGLPFTYYMRLLADNAISLMDALRDEGDEIEEAEEVVRRITWLIARKQHDYGHGNITAFGERGLVVRINDKIERLANLLARGDGYANESIEDTLDDVVGYALIGIMLHQGTFTLPLAADLPGSIVEVPADTSLILTPEQFTEVFGEDAVAAPQSLQVQSTTHFTVHPNGDVEQHFVNDAGGRTVYVADVTAASNPDGHAAGSSPFQEWLRALEADELEADDLGGWRG